MKKILFLLSLVFVFSCEKPVEKPKNLLSEEQMAATLAEIIIAEQLNTAENYNQPDLPIRSIFVKNKIEYKNFTESHNYYLAAGKLDNIYEEAQDIIRAKDAKSEEFIDQKIAEEEKKRKEEEKRKKEEEKRLKEAAKNKNQSQKK